MWTRIETVSYYSRSLVMVGNGAKTVCTTKGDEDELLALLNAAGAVLDVIDHIDPTGESLTSADRVTVDALRDSLLPAPHSEPACPRCGGKMTRTDDGMYRDCACGFRSS